MLYIRKWVPKAVLLRTEVLYREEHVASPEATAGGWEQGGLGLFIAKRASGDGGASFPGNVRPRRNVRAKGFAAERLKYLVQNLKSFSTSNIRANSTRDTNPLCLIVETALFRNRLPVAFSN